MVATAEKKTFTLNRNQVAASKLECARSIKWTKSSTTATKQFIWLVGRRKANMQKKKQMKKIISNKSKLYCGQEAHISNVQEICREDWKKGSGRKQIVEKIIKVILIDALTDFFRMKIYSNSIQCNVNASLL